MDKPSLNVTAAGAPPVPETSEARGSFFSGVVLTFGTRLLMFLGVFGSSVVVARWLGAEGLGKLAVLNTTMMLALQIGNAGLPSANTYFIAKDRGNLNAAWANSVVFALIGGTLIAAVVVLVVETMPGLFAGVPPNLLMIAAISIPFQLMMILGLNLLLAVGRIGQLNLLDSMAPALALLNAVFVLVVLQGKLPMLVSFNTGALVALGVVTFWVTSRLIQPRKFAPDYALAKGMLVYGLKFYISIMAGIVIFRADLLIVNHFRGAGEAGVYAVAGQVSFLLLVLPGVISTLLFPRVAADQDAKGVFATQVTRYSSAVMFILCVAAAIGSFALPLVYGASFADSTFQLLILLPGIYLVGLESVMVQHFTGTGLPGAIPAFWLITLTINIGLNLALVPRFGARGAAFASTLSYALISGLVAVYFCMKTSRRLAEIFLPRGNDLRDLFARSRNAIFPKSV